MDVADSRPGPSRFRPLQIPKCAPGLAAHSEAEESPDAATPSPVCPSAPASGHFLREACKATQRGCSLPPPPRRRPVSRRENAAARPFPPVVPRAGGQPHNFAPHLSQPWPPSPSPPRAGTRTRGTEGAPCRARAPRRGSRGGSGLTGRRAGRVGPREPASRPGGARRGTRESSSRGRWQDARSAR